MEIAEAAKPLAEQAADLLKKEDPKTYNKLEKKYNKAVSYTQDKLAKGTDLYNQYGDRIEAAAEKAKEQFPDYADSIDSGLDYYGQGSEYLDHANDIAAHYGLIDLDSLTDEELLELFSFKKAWKSAKKSASKAASSAYRGAKSVAKKGYALANDPKTWQTIKSAS